MERYTAPPTGATMIAALRREHRAEIPQIWYVRRAMPDRQ
jgi:hypothetical protein